MSEPFPSAPDSDYFTAVFGGTIGDFFDYGIEAGNIAASSEDADTLSDRHGPFYSRPSSTPVSPAPGGG